MTDTKPTVSDEVRSSFDLSRFEGHTPGPWGWHGNAGSKSLQLSTKHSGRRHVMTFTRWGFNGAQPQFQPGKHGMVKAADLLQFEVGNKSIVGVKAAEKDDSVYRYDVRGIACADAELIAAAPDILSRVRTLEAALREIQDFTGALEDDDPMSHVYVVARQALGGHDA